MFRYKKCQIWLISKGIFNQISTALYFAIFAPEFERVFVKVNCRALVCLVLYETKSVMILNNCSM